MRDLLLDPGDELSLADDPSVAADASHALARTIAAGLKSESARLLTTKPVLFEIGNALSRLRYRAAGVLLLESLVVDPNVTIMEDTPERFRSALDLYVNRPDKEWGLVDCLSFVVMAERQLTEALTADAHFIQAGYRALLRE